MSEIKPDIRAKKKSVILWAKVQPEVKLLLDLEAVEKGIGISELVRNIVINHLEKEGKI